MQISRCGSERYHGPSLTEFEPRTIRWDHIKKVVELRASFVPDFNTKANHDWEVSVNLKELTLMINVVADALTSEMFGVENAELIAREMTSSLTSLLRIATICSQSLDESKAI